MRRLWMLLLVLGLVMVTLLPHLAQAGAITPGLFNNNTLPANDDAHTGLVSLGFNANFFGTTYTGLYVSNNGNVTFNNPNYLYNHFDLTIGGGSSIIAPFYADVDTRGSGSGLVTYGTGTYGGHNAFGVNWIDVGYYLRHTNKLNSFQLVVIDRSDVAAGDFDIMFNYDKIQWESGDASSGGGGSFGVNGLGGFSAHAGYSSGTGTPGTFYEFPGSGVNGALLDGGPDALISNSNVGLDGRYVFEVRNGTPIPVVPLPPTVLLLGSGLLGLAGLRRKLKG